MKPASTPSPLGVALAFALGTFACSAAPAEDATEDSALVAEGNAVKPTPRAVVKVLWRDGGTNDWRAKEPSSLDGAPIGTALPRVREVYARLFARLATSKAPPSVVLVNVARTADQERHATDAALAKAMSSAPFPFVLPVLPDKAPDALFYGIPQVNVGHDRAFFQCLEILTPDGSRTCQRGAKVTPLGPLAFPADASGSATAPPAPFPSTVVAAAAFQAARLRSLDLSKPLARERLDAMAAALAPLIEETDAITSSGAKGSHRSGVVARALAMPSPLPFSQVLTSDEVLESLAGSVVIVGGSADSADDQWFGPNQPQGGSAITMAADLQRMLQVSLKD